MGDRVYMFNFQKFWKDLKYSLIAAAPGIAAFLYFWRVRVFDWPPAGYGPNEIFLMSGYSLVAAIGFWMSLLLAYEVVQNLIQRYIRCEQVREGGEER